MDFIQYLLAIAFHFRRYKLIEWRINHYVIDPVTFYDMFINQNLTSIIYIWHICKHSLLS